MPPPTPSSFSVRCRRYRDLNARVAALAAGAVSEPGFMGPSDAWLDAGPDGSWGNGSIGDLEALDSILDHLVVLDNRMRGALLKVEECIVHKDPRSPQSPQTLKAPCPGFRV